MLSNPKAVLEKSLRAFSCLTAGETISIYYADTEFDIDILEVKPNTLGAISLIDTDVQVGRFRWLKTGSMIFLSRWSLRHQKIT